MRYKIEAVIFLLIAEAYLLNESVAFYMTRPLFSSLITTIMVYLPWVLGVAYVAFRLYNRAKSVPQRLPDELDLAIRQHVDHPSAESAARINELLAVVKEQK